MATDTATGDRFITVTEVGMRDGLQAEPEFVSTATKIYLINELVSAGLRHIEFSSFVSPRAVPQLADAAAVIAGVDRVDGLCMTALVPNLKGAERAIDAGVDRIHVFVSASEQHNQKNVNQSIDQSLDGIEQVARVSQSAGIPVSGAIATAFGCPFQGDVPIEDIVAIADRFEAIGINMIGLGDTTGMATPPLVRSRCEALMAVGSRRHVILHFHNTRGIGLCNVMTGLDVGITEFESSLGGLGGCPFAPGATGNICTEDLVYLLHESGYQTDIDLEALCDVASQMQSELGHALPGQVMKAGPRLKMHATDSVVTAAG